MRLSKGGGQRGINDGFSGTKCIHAYSARHDIYPTCLGNWALGRKKTWSRGLLLIRVVSGSSL
jgi:hypothetical protein